MDAGFWKQRWQEGRIGFHQDRVTPLLQQHWDALGLRRDATVLVPLAGKSFDMNWLAARGHRVIGVELSEVAVRDFFAERGVEPQIHADHNGVHHRAGDITLLLGDAFALDETLLASCDAVFDRAALIALPSAMRKRYADTLYARMPADCECLLITLEYPQHEKQGPPFSVASQEVQALFAHDWRIESLERKDILAEQSGFVSDGVTALRTVAYRMQRRRG